MIEHLPLSAAEKLRLISHLDPAAIIRKSHDHYVLDAMIVLRDGRAEGWLSEMAADENAAIEAWWQKAIVDVPPWAYLEARDAAWMFEPAQRTWRRLASWEIDDRDAWCASAMEMSARPTRISPEASSLRQQHLSPSTHARSERFLLRALRWLWRRTTNTHRQHPS